MPLSTSLRGVRHERNLVQCRQKSNLKSRNPTKSRNPLWNPEIHFEIQKSTLKSGNPLWNPEIQSSLCLHWRHGLCMTLTNDLWGDICIISFLFLYIYIFCFFVFPKNIIPLYSKTEYNKHVQAWVKEQIVYKEEKSECS